MLIKRITMTDVEARTAISRIFSSLRDRLVRDNTSTDQDDHSLLDDENQQTPEDIFTIENETAAYFSDVELDQDESQITNPPEKKTRRTKSSSPCVVQ